LGLTFNLVSEEINYSSFHYIKENLMGKLHQIFKVQKGQKRIVSAETIRGNTVSAKKMPVSFSNAIARVDIF
jgi:hypothetical protein